ncbi:MAG: YIP1 family protein [Clostridiales bacterium]|jgi:hypothetical protein|nr:YIP1 family protein [Clostridiales bacterium]
MKARGVSVRRALENFGYGFYVMIRPIYGFEEMKNEGKGSAPAAAAVALLAVFAFLLETHNTGFIFSTFNPNEYNVIRHLAGAAVPFALWCAANWCVSVVLDGEGSLKYIFMAACYALAPYIVFTLAATGLSNVLLYEEQMFIKYASGLGTLWSGLLLFTGSMVIHQYTVRRTVLSFVLSVFGILLMMFIAILFASVLDKIYRFAAGIYNEVRLRM